MIEKANQDLSISHQCDLLGLCRSRLYYKPVGQESEDNLILMIELDKQYLKTPFYGIRRMTAHLRSLGYCVNHKRVQRLMRKMGLEAVYRKPNTSLPNKEHTIYAYLLKGLKITRPNQVWATDITARAAPLYSDGKGVYVFDSDCRFIFKKSFNMVG